MRVFAFDVVGLIGVELFDDSVGAKFGFLFCSGDDDVSPYRSRCADN